MFASSSSPSHFLHPPLFPFNLFPANPTHPSLIRTIAGSGVANSAEIMGCQKTKGSAGLRVFKMCRRANRKLTCQSEKIFLFFPPCGTFFFSFSLEIWPQLWGSGWVCLLWQRRLFQSSTFQKGEKRTENLTCNSKGWGRLKHWQKTIKVKNRTIKIQAD